MSESPLSKILIVDDETAQMTALCNTLRDHGYETVGCSSGKMALAELDKAEFDLMLSDLMMPEMDGIALLQAALKKNPELVGIIMTGEGTITTAVEAMKSGALDYILKPFKLSAILPVLARALSVRRLRRENKELHQRVLERTAELEVANRELESFSYSVSHDLRSPVRHINGYGEMLKKTADPKLDEQERRLLNTIMKSATHMGQLIDDLLEFSRLGRQQLTKERFDLKALALRVWQALERDEPGREIDFKVGELGDCLGDPSLLQQVFVNLLANARKFTRKKAKVMVEVGVMQQGAERVYFVRDNGAGFNMAHAGKLFGVFERLHRAGDFEGTGVGLSIVQRIIQRHGGRIWAEGEEDQGATFFFTLPD